MPGSFEQHFSTRLPLPTVQIEPLQGAEGPASADIQIRDRAIIETNEQDELLIRVPQAKLFNSKEELLSLIGELSHLTIFGETGNECHAVASDSLPDFIPPVLARPQAAEVTPDWNTVCLKKCLQAINAPRILPDIGDKHVAVYLARLRLHSRSLTRLRPRPSSRVVRQA